MSIRAAEIYKDILTMKNISEQAQESYVRNLRKKMNFLVEKVALRKVSDFKEGNNILIVRIEVNNRYIICYEIVTNATFNV